MERGSKLVRKASSRLFKLGEEETKTPKTPEPNGIPQFASKRSRSDNGLTIGKRMNSIFRQGNELMKQSSFRAKSRANTLIQNIKGPSKFGKLSVIQYAGVLEKKGEMFWKKKYFVIKDGFLIWYRSMPHDDKNNFSLYPSGFWPLSGCSVSPEGRDGTGFLLQVQILIPNVVDKKLILRSRSEENINQWLGMLDTVSKVSFDVAKLGKVRMQFYQKETNMTETEKEKVLENARNQAKLAYEANQNKRELMEKQIKERKRNLKKLEQEKKKVKEQAIQLESKLLQVNTKKEELESETRHKTRLEGNLDAALTEIQRLQLFVLEHKGNPLQKHKILQDLKVLKSILCS